MVAVRPDLNCVYRIRMAGIDRNIDRLRKKRSFHLINSDSLVCDQRLSSGNVFLPCFPVLVLEYRIIDFDHRKKGQLLPSAGIFILESSRKQPLSGISGLLCSCAIHSAGQCRTGQKLGSLNRRRKCRNAEMHSLADPGES